jgi:transcription elongation factor SPT5
MEKDAKVSALVLENVNPTLEEITLFTGGAVNEAERELMAMAQDTPAIVQDFKVGENVEVVEGALINLPGIVQSVENNIVTIKPLGGFGLEVRRVT